MKDGVLFDDSPSGNLYLHNAHLDYYKVAYMAEKEIAAVLNEKGKDLKSMFKDLDATLETWKFSMEESKEGMRVEIHAVALIKKDKKKE